MRELLLFVHIAAAAVWIGAGVTQLVVSPVIARTGGTAAAVWMRQTVRLGRVLFSPASVLVLISGVWLVLRETAFEFEQAFVVIGILAVVLGAFLGMRVYGPTGEVIAQLHDDGKTAEANAKLSRMFTIASAEVAFLLFTLWAMVNKLGL